MRDWTRGRSCCSEEFRSFRTTMKRRSPRGFSNRSTAPIPRRSEEFSLSERRSASGNGSREFQLEESAGHRPYRVQAADRRRSQGLAEQPLCFPERPHVVSVVGLGEQEPDRALRPRGADRAEDPAALLVGQVMKKVHAKDHREAPEEFRRKNRGVPDLEGPPGMEPTGLLDARSVEVNAGVSTRRKEVTVRSGSAAELEDRLALLVCVPLADLSAVLRVVPVDKPLKSAVGERGKSHRELVMLSNAGRQIPRTGLREPRRIAQAQAFVCQEDRAHRRYDRDEERVRQQRKTDGFRRADSSGSEDQDTRGLVNS